MLMKKIYSYLVAFYFLTLIVGLSACSNEREENIPNEDPVAKVVSGEDLVIIAKLGFDISEVEDMGDYYLVEGDIAIPKENIPGYAKAIAEADTSRLKQARSTYLVSVSNITDIKVKIDASLYSVSNWRQATLDAISYYNNALSNVRMREVTSGQDITIKAGSLAGNVCGEGGFPSADGKAYPYIDLSTEYNSLTQSQKAFLIAHELGHCIGLRHTNWYTPSDSEYKEPDAIQIPGTPSKDNPLTGGSAYNPDPSSVFNGRTCGYAWAGFSNYDLMALRTLYSPSFAIKSDNMIACVNENVVYTLSGNIPADATITWQGTQNATLVSGQATKSATFKVSGYAYAKVQAVITRGTSVTVENSGVWVGPPRFVGSPNYQSTIKRDLLESFFLTAIFNGSPGSYDWQVNGEPLSARYLDAGDGTISILLKYLRVGDYTYTVDVSNTCGSASELFFVTITN